MNDRSVSRYNVSSVSTIRNHDGQFVLYKDYLALDAERRALLEQVQHLQQLAWINELNCNRQELAKDEALAKLAQVEARLKDDEALRIILARVTGALVDAGLVKTENVEKGIQQLTAQRDEALAKLAQMEQKLATTLPSAIYTHKILQLEQRVAELETAATRVCSYHVVNLFGPECPPLDSPQYHFARDRDALRTLLFSMEPPL